MIAEFNIANWPSVSSEIFVNEIPRICDDSTHAAHDTLQALNDDLTVGLTYEDWLWNQIQEQCQELPDAIADRIIEIKSFSSADTVSLKQSYDQAVIDGTVTNDSTVHDEAISACISGSNYKNWLEEELWRACEAETGLLETEAEMISKLEAALTRTSVVLDAMVLTSYIQDSGTSLDDMIHWSRQNVAENTVHGMEIIPSGYTWDDPPEVCPDAFSEAKDRLPDLSNELSDALTYLTYLVYIPQIHPTLDSDNKNLFENVY